MKKNKQKELERMQNNYDIQEEPQYEILREKTLKELIAPSGIDASNIDHLEIISNTTRYARSFFVSSLPRMCTFPELFRDMYLFGDINTSIYITPVPEARSQTDLNRVINQLETERIVAADRGNINRESILAQKRLEAEQLRDQIAAGFNKLYETSIVATLFAYNLQSLEAYTKLLATEMSKTLVGIKSAWAMQEEAFQSNLPLMQDKVKKTLEDAGKQFGASIKISSVTTGKYMVESFGTNCWKTELLSDGTYKKHIKIGIMIEIPDMHRKIADIKHIMPRIISTN